MARRTVAAAYASGRVPTVYKTIFSEERNQHEKALAIILSVMMLMSTLVACGSKTDDSGDANNDAAASYPTKM